jgi:hypothetical protein
MREQFKEVKFRQDRIEMIDLCNQIIDGYLAQGLRLTLPDNTQMLLITPLRFHRRQLHRLQPESGGTRKPYGGTRSLGFKRGSLVKHALYGLSYIGGYLKGQISLHSLVDGKRLTQNAKLEDCRLLTFSSWRCANSSPCLKTGISLARI